MQKCRQFDVGVTISANLTDDGEPFDPTGASLIELILQPPGADPFVRLAAIIDAPTGEVGYETVAGDIGWHGLWRYQFHLIGPGAIDIRSEVLTFTAEPNLRPPDVFLRPDPATIYGGAPVASAS